MLTYSHVHTHSYTCHMHLFSAIFDVAVDRNCIWRISGCARADTTRTSKSKHALHSQILKALKIYYTPINCQHTAQRSAANICVSERRCAGPARHHYCWRLCALTHFALYFMVSILSSVIAKVSLVTRLFTFKKRSSTTLSANSQTAN